MITDAQLDAAMANCCADQKDREVRIALYDIAEANGVPPQEILGSLQRSVVGFDPGPDYRSLHAPLEERQPRNIRIRDQNDEHE